MKKKNIVSLIIILVFMLIIGGCSNNDGIVDNIAGDEGQEILVPNRESQYLEALSAEELKEVLKESVGVELRDTNNQAVGLLEDRDQIIEFVETLFTYPKQEKFLNNSDENQVVGPIHFYFNNNEDLFGLMKEDFIYIEGYYFLITENQKNNIVNLFKNNIIQAPNSGN